MSIQDYKHAILIHDDATKAYFPKSSIKVLYLTNDSIKIYLYGDEDTGPWAIDRNEEDFNKLTEIMNAWWEENCRELSNEDK